MSMSPPPRSADSAAPQSSWPLSRGMPTASRRAMSRSTSCLIGCNPVGAGCRGERRQGSMRSEGDMNPSSSGPLGAALYGSAPSMMDQGPVGLLVLMLRFAKQLFRFCKRAVYVEMIKNMLRRMGEGAIHVKLDELLRGRSPPRRRVPLPLLACGTTVNTWSRI